MKDVEVLCPRSRCKTETRPVGILWGWWFCPGCGNMGKYNDDEFPYNHQVHGISAESLNTKYEEKRKEINQWYHDTFGEGVILQCPDHKRYKGVGSPRKVCLTCWFIYFDNHNIPIGEPCEEHETYSGSRTPRKPCEMCWALYIGNNEDKVTLNRIKK